MRSLLGTLALALVFAVGCDENPTQPPGDTTAPAPVADLHIETATETSLTLAWTAVGDDGTTGTASRYDIRISTDNLQGNAWDAADSVLTVPVPQNAGSSETVIVADLDRRGTHYYFALRTADDVPNWSEWSNTAGSTGLNTPPTASFGNAPITELLAGAVFKVSAEASLDVEDVLDSLLVRWDWEDDGVWDTPWTHEKTATHTYMSAGSRTIRLEVRDTGGFVDQATQQRLVRGINSSAELVVELDKAYLQRDLNAYTLLLANDPLNRAEFRFYLDHEIDGELLWGYSEEVRLHRRMFRPYDLPPEEPAVAPELWPVAIMIALTQATPFTERTDLYESTGNPMGLDPGHWKAREARYVTYVFWDMQGVIDYKVDGEANFIVIEDLTKNAGESGRFLLYIWEDLAVTTVAAVEQASWSAMKNLYR